MWALVAGVQTFALPILNEEASRHQPLELETELASRMGTDGDRPFVGRGVEGKDSCHAGISWARPHRPHPPSNPLPFPGSSRATDPPASGKRNIEARGEIGRASCRERVCQYV